MFQMIKQMLVSYKDKVSEQRLEFLKQLFHLMKGKTFQTNLTLCGK